MDRENFKRGSFLKQLRTSNGMSERDLAEILDVEKSDIAVWETGIKFPDDSATIERLAKLFHVTKREILNGEYKKERTTTEVEYNEKTVTTEDTLLSNTGKNVLIVALSCVILLILVVSIYSVASNINKKVNLDLTQYQVSDEREEIIHVPRRINETVITNTTALTANYTYNADKLLAYGFTKSGNKYSKSFDRNKIEFYDGKFYLTYKSRQTSYKEIYSKDVFGSKFQVTVYNGTIYYDYEDEGGYTAKNCYAYSCSNTTDYKRYVNFLINEIRE